MTDLLASVPLKIDIFVDSWTGKHQNAAHIAKAMHAIGYRVTIVYCDENDILPSDPCRLVLVPREWFFGKKFEKCLNEFSGDIMLHITADARCDDWCALVRRCREAFERVPQLGIWSPTIEGSNCWTLERTAIATIEAGSLHLVTQTNEIVWALSAEVVNHMRSFDFDKSNLGGGIDTAAALFCHVNNKLIAVDGTVFVHHPHGTSYDSDESRKQMENFLKQLTAQEQAQHELIREYFNRSHIITERDGLRAERDALKTERDGLLNLIEIWRRRLRWPLWVRARLRELFPRHSP